MAENEGLRINERKGCARRRWIIASLVIAAATVVGASFIFSRHDLDKNDIDAILKAALADKKTVPDDACLSLPGAELPADVNTASLLRVDGKVRSNVQALIKNGLITVRFDSGKGSPTVRNPDYESTDTNAPLSHIELTPLGKSFYRYREYETADPSSAGGMALHMVSSICAHVSFGGVEKFMDPARNPFDDNPHRVTWVNFMWKPDERTTPWLADPDLKGALPFYPEKDGWAHEGILLEQGDNGRWGLGAKPYIIRW